MLIIATHPGLSRYWGITNLAAKQRLVSFLDEDISHCLPVVQTIYYMDLPDILPSPFPPLQTKISPERLQLKVERGFLTFPSVIFQLRTTHTKLFFPST